MLFWLVISLIGALALLEITLSIIQFGEQEYLKVDPLLGLVHLEDKTVTWRTEGFSHERMNSAGFCDIARTLDKPPGVIRVAVFGDSFTEAMQVPLLQRFTQGLQSKLNHNVHSKFEVLNCGISGFGIGHEYLLYVNRIAAYKPDITILCINQWEADKNTVWPTRPTFAFGKNERLKLQWTDFEKWCRSKEALPFTFFEWGRRNSRVWGVVLQAYRDLQEDKAYRKLCLRISQVIINIQNLLHLIGPEQAKPPLNMLSCRDAKLDSERLLLCKEAGLLTDDLKAPRGSANANDFASDTRKKNWQNTTEEHWRITRAIVRQFADKCLANHSTLVLVALPVKWQTVSYQERFDWLTSLHGNRHVPLLNTIPAFLGAQSKQSEPFFLAGHFSAHGHKLIANLLYNFLEQRHLLDSTRLAKSSEE